MPKFRISIKGALIAALAVAPLLSLTAVAAFPDGTITIIAPAAAGGGTDLTARNLARFAEPLLNVPIVTSNMPGGGNAIGLTAGNRARPDGYTLTLGQVETVLLPLMGRVGWQAADFVPIMGVNAAHSALTVRADSRWQTAQQFLDEARRNPGRLRVGGSAPGTIWHLAAAGLSAAAGVSFNIIPYTGGAAPAIQDLLGGQIDAITVSAGEVSEHLRAGRVRILGMMRAERDPSFPDVATFNELGLRNVVYATWWALLAPPGTAADVVATLHRAFKQAWDHPEFQGFLTRSGLEPMYIPPEQFQAFMATEAVKFRPVLSDLGLLGR